MACMATKPTPKENSTPPETPGTTPNPETTDGAEALIAEAEELLSSAKADAEKILDDAKAEAQKLVDEAKLAAAKIEGDAAEKLDTANALAGLAAGGEIEIVPGRQSPFASNLSGYVLKTRDGDPAGTPEDLGKAGTSPENWAWHSGYVLAAPGADGDGISLVNMEITTAVNDSGFTTEQYMDRARHMAARCAERSVRAVPAWSPNLALAVTVQIVDLGPANLPVD